MSEVASPADQAARARTRELAAERRRFVAFSFASADLLIELNAEGRITFATGAARALTGRMENELLGMRFLDLVAEGDRRFVELALGNVPGGGRLDPSTLFLKRTSGRDMGVALSGGRVVEGGLIHLSISIAQAAHAESALANRKDKEQGLLAVAEFRTAANDRLRAAKEMGSDVRLTLLDMCGLDELAGRIGPEASEALMKDIGTTLRLHAPVGSAVGEVGPGRLGVLHGAGTDPDRLRAAVEGLGRAADPNGVGITVENRTLDMNMGDLSAEDGAKALNYAISRFAKGGAGNFEMASGMDSLKLLLADTVERINSFRQIVVNQSFRMAYQPILGLRDRQTHHWEALARLEGTDSPFETIRFAEATEIVEEFDLAVVERVLKTLEARKAGAPPVLVAVNLSGGSIGSPVFLSALDNLLASYPAGRRQMAFEITESTKIEDLEGAAVFVRHLKQAGHEVCLDDFGAGASSFPYLQALPVDFVKIDGAYVKRALEDKRDRAIMRSMTGLCVELGIKTVAEMIETEDQAALLEGMGVDYGQGWLFGTPAPELPSAPPKVLPSVTRRTSPASRGGTSATPSPLRRS